VVQAPIGACRCGYYSGGDPEYRILVEGGDVGLDIRLPIGLMFSIFGLLLVVYGYFGNQTIYARSLGINVNLWWGIVMLAFGLVMLRFGLSGRQEGNSKKET
jgi:hypothetical protein